jgi:hypothetical protein
MIILSVLEVAMLVVTGTFENERFIPDRPVSIPQKKKVVVTIEEKPDTGIKSANKWREIGEAILNCDEELPGSPQPVQFRTMAEMEAL